MPIAAVPAYLGQDFSSASPGLRFGMYLPIWTNRADQEREVNGRAGRKSREAFEIQDLLRTHGMDAVIATLGRRERSSLPGLWDKNDFAARNAWEKVLKLTRDDSDTMRALAQRQAAAAQTMPNLLTLDAVAIAPFTTGLGNEHPLENGFAFLNPYGLPYLPGSGVKGVLRQAARELASGEWGNAHGWATEKAHMLERKGGKPIALSTIDALFGLESADGDTDHVRGALSFWDAIPQIAGDSLTVGIMTPHQSHYYQQRADRKSGNSTSPHDSGAPNPISFLTLPPGTGFAFYVTCDEAQLTRLAPDLAHDNLWQNLVTAAFEHAFEWLGFGAKTAVGYGAMAPDTQAADKRAAAEAERQQAVEQEQRQRERAAAVAAMSPVEQEIARCLDERTDPNLQEIPALISALKAGRWSSDVKRGVAEHVGALMKAQKGQWKEQSAKRNPAKDRDYQNTLQVQRWIAGE